jgi:beta-lactam-binding protein with PASTA domain
VDIQVIEKRKSTDFDVNHIIDQNPSSGHRIKKGRMIYLVVSTGYDQIEVPDLAGMQLRQASLNLRNQGFFVGSHSYLFAGENQRGRILSHYPMFGTLCARGETVSLLVGANRDEIKHRVPLLKKKNIDDVRLKLRQLKVEIGQISYREDSGLFEGMVLDQSPNPGAELVEGYTKIDLVVNRFVPETLIEKGGTGQVEIRLPSGLSTRRLRVELVDATGSKILHEREHFPDDLLYLEVQHQGRAHINLYLDGFFYKRMEPVGNVWQ